MNPPATWAYKRPPIIAFSCNGGAIYFYGPAGAGGATVRNSTISGNNSFNGSGGGIGMQFVDLSQQVEHFMKQRRSLRGDGLAGLGVQQIAGINSRRARA